MERATLLDGSSIVSTNRTCRLLGYTDKDAYYAEVLADQGEEIERLRKVVDAAMNVSEIINTTYGIVGWHLNGNVAAWEEFEDVKELMNALAELDKENNCVD